jgi:thiol-disulfide isomerase/thioredoxin
VGVLRGYTGEDTHLNKPPPQETRTARWLRRAFWVLAFLGVPYLVFQFRGHVRLMPATDAVPATALTLVDLGGQPVRLEEHRGKVVLLNLWASWCQPCRMEIPGLSELHDTLGDDGLVVLGLSVDSLPRSRIRELREELGITYPVVLPTGPLDGSFRERGVIPHTWFIDREGRVRASHAGLATLRSLRRASGKLLAEP